MLILLWVIKMVYSFKELLNIYKTRYNIDKAIQNKELFKLDNNIYSTKEIVNPIIFYSKKYPNAIITMDTAFYYYDLTDVIPQKTCMATSYNSRVIKDSDVTQIRVSKDNINIGKIVVKIDGNDVNIYDRERLLIELVRKKNQIPYDYYKELIYNYRNIANELDMYKIEMYVQVFKNEYNITDTMLREVF